MHIARCFSLIKRNKLFNGYHYRVLNFIIITLLRGEKREINYVTRVRQTRLHFFANISAVCITRWTKSYVRYFIALWRLV